MDLRDEIAAAIRDELADQGVLWDLEDEDPLARLAIYTGEVADLRRVCDRILAIPALRDALAEAQQTAQFRRTVGHSIQVHRDEDGG
jgi:hypothetical protein